LFRLYLTGSDHTRLGVIHVRDDHGHSLPFDKVFQRMKNVRLDHRLTGNAMSREEAQGPDHGDPP